MALDSGYFEVSNPVKTNADRIRSMSDEELEEGIRILSLRLRLGYEPWCDNHCKMNGDDDCNRCLRSWIQQPAETSIKDDCLGMDVDGNGY